MTALSNLNKVWDQLSTGKLTTSSCRLTRDAEAALELALNGKTRGTLSIAIASVSTTIMATRCACSMMQGIQCARVLLFKQYKFMY